MTTESRGAQTGLPWLSILIPVYNVAPYLRQCIDSILRQLPAQGVEVVLLDDASTDNSRHVAEEICAAHGATVRLLVHERNGGLSAARNTLLEAASGRYIWFIDSDDEMLPGAIDTLRTVTTRHAPDIILCDFRKQGREVVAFIGPERTLSRDREALVRGVFASRCMYAWSRVVRHEIWGGDLRFPVGRDFEDIMTTPWLCLRASSFYYVREPWISYRIRKDSILGSVSRTRGHFDARRNDNLAGALAGFTADARAALPDMSERTCYDVSAFWEKEFSKISWRLVQARFRKEDWQTIVSGLRRYQEMMEPCSPISFTRLATLHLRYGRLVRWLILRVLLVMNHRSTS